MTQTPRIANARPSRLHPWLPVPKAQMHLVHMLNPESQCIPQDRKSSSILSIAYAYVRILLCIEHMLMFPY